ncbi:5-formyltetrahydrofolate cyclo-ligase [Candidatus Peregrinibacteria bacterium]|nr:5-formyltetrahydrofolate cyclo-ligase [Candidatus Peregrinibacteria bacterium]
MINKASLRKKILLKRKNQNAKTKLQKDKKIISAVLADALYKKSQNILFFMPILGEPDITALIKSAFKLKKGVYLPKVDKSKNWLHIHQIKNLSELRPGAYKIMEPHHTAPKINPKKINLAFVPGIVFDEKGNRIGFGKGYYDRLLKKMSCKKIGLAYKFQIVKNIPCSAHDVKVDEIITEKRRITS